jgi:putative ABC transport system ATP-binding protein
MAAGSSRSSSGPSAVIEATDVRKVYTRGPERGPLSRALGRSEPATVTAVDGVSLGVEPGEIVGLAGPSGSGKSTLLHLLAGLDVPTEGTVRFREHDLGELSERQRTRFRLEHVGIVFQGFHILESLSARANVALPLVEQGIGKRERRRRATELLERVGLGDRITHLPGELSGGERQRVAIARALITDPTYVVADEPTGELDTATGRRVLEEFEAIAEDRAVVMASHDEATRDIADRVLTLRDGTLLENAEPAPEPDTIEAR